MQSTFKIEYKELLIKRWLMFFILILFLSGLTAIPVQQELTIAAKLAGDESIIGKWLSAVHEGVNAMAANYPFLFYGYDWLAFAHFVLAILFIGPYKDPVRNKWVIEFGMIACILIIPFAMIAGYARGIPFWWRLIDCSFGVFGLIPLGICYGKITELEVVQKENHYVWQ